MASVVVRNGRFLIMKKIRIVLLTLVLCITMLAPEFSMLPAVYAEDKTPAPSATQSADSVASAAAPAAPETSVHMPATAQTPQQTRKAPPAQTPAHPPQQIREAATDQAPQQLRRAATPQLRQPAMSRSRQPSAPILRIPLRSKPLQPAPLSEPALCPQTLQIRPTLKPRLTLQIRRHQLQVSVLTTCLK